MRFSVILAMAGQGILPSAMLAVILYGFYDWKTKRSDPMVGLFIFYVCMLFYVTVYRYGITFDSLTADRPDVNLIPLVSTLALLKYNGWLIFLYNVIGNIVWFYPLGLFLTYFYQRISLWKVLLYSVACSCLIEFVQYLLNVGISDIDDVIFNMIGGLLGGLTVILVRYINKIK